jgi:hypothetical protein
VNLALAGLQTPFDFETEMVRRLAMRDEIGIILERLSLVGEVIYI